jgi:heme/copper-type cytochrome/quinol oxidase subunit 2
MKQTLDSKNIDKFNTLLWSAMGIMQVVIVTVVYIYVFLPQDSLQLKRSIPEIDSTIIVGVAFAFAFVLALAGQFFYLKAAKETAERKPIFYILSWVLAESVTLIGVIGLLTLWTDMKTSISFWATGFVLWLIRFPKN